MKKRTYIYVTLCIMAIILSVVSCMDEYLVKPNAQTEMKGFSLQEAKEFFENQMMQSSVTTRSVSGGDDKRIIPGDFVPNWENAVGSTRKGLLCYDIPIKAHYRYKAMYCDYERGTPEIKTVNVYQKLVVVKEEETEILGQYILTLIPTKRCESKNGKTVCDKFVNCADKGGFSGFAIYTVTQTGFIIRADQYVDGVRIRGVFLGGSRETLKEKVPILSSILQGVRIARGMTASTRSSGEDWEYSMEDYWPIADGLYYDRNNDVLVIDYDGDGKPESVWLPEVEITPDEPGEEPIPTPDPLPDEPVGGDGGFGGGLPAPIPPPSPSRPIIAKILFKNANMTAANWAMLQSLINQILSTCLGEALVGGLEAALNGSTMDIHLGIGDKSSFGPLAGGNNGIMLSTNLESDQLLHEMFHALKFYLGGGLTAENAQYYEGSKMNSEIEAHYAQYVYMNGQSEEVAKQWNSTHNDSRWKLIGGLTYFVDSHGRLLANKEEYALGNHLFVNVVPGLEKFGYSQKSYPFDVNNLGVGVFSNLTSLTINCNE